MLRTMIDYIQEQIAKHFNLIIHLFNIYLLLNIYWAPTNGHYFRSWGYNSEQSSKSLHNGENV